jgi:hypothetical protein
LTFSDDRDLFLGMMELLALVGLPLFQYTIEPPFDVVFHLLFELAELFLNWVGKVLVIQGAACEDALTLLSDDHAWDSDDGAGGWDVLEHDGPCPDHGVVSDTDIAEDLGPCADHHVLFDGWVTLAGLLAGTAEGDALVDGDIVADLSGLTDNDSHTMIDEDAFADGGAGVDFDPCQKPGDLG